MTAGTLSIEVFDFWDEEFWSRFAGLEGTIDISEVFQRVAAESNPITAVKTITAPNGNTRAYVYHNLFPSQIDDGDTITVAGLQVAKAMVCLYTHRTRL